MALNLDTDGFRRAGELVDTAGQVLGTDFDDDVPPCGTDEVSRTVMDNLNARRRWLMQHVRAGVVQTSDAAAGINQTATGYEAEDTHGASLYGAAGGHGGGAAPAVMASAPTSGGSAPPAGMPAVSSVPDLSGLEGKPWPKPSKPAPVRPAAAAAARLVGLASQAAAANVTLVGAHTQLMASGESAAHPDWKPSSPGASHGLRRYPVTRPRWPATMRLPGPCTPPPWPRWGPRPPGGHSRPAIKRPLRRTTPWPEWPKQRSTRGSRH